MSDEEDRQEEQEHQEEAAQEEEPKQEADPTGPINVKVVTSTGDEVFFKIKKNTKMSKLKGAYAQRVGKDVNTIRFLYDGERLAEDDTPASLDMSEGDTIDVMVEQVGGGERRR